MGWSLRSRYNLSIQLCAISAFVLSGLVKYLALGQTTYANGWDGYYYIMQAHSWLELGYLQSLDYSIIYPYFTAISYLIGDYVLAFKVGTALIAATLATAVFLLVRDGSGSRSVAALAAVLIVFSPTLTYFLSQFPKNAMGLVFLVFFLRSVGKGRVIWALVFFVLAMLTHRMIAGLCLLAVAAYSIRQLHWKWLVLGALLLFGISWLPGVLHISDLARFQGQFSHVPHFAPYAFWQLFSKSTSFWWELELILLSILIIYLIINYLRSHQLYKKELLKGTILPLLLVIAVFPFFRMETGSMGYRFFLIAPVIAIIYATSTIRLSFKLATILSGIIIITSFFSFKAYNPNLHDPPYRLFEAIVDRLEQQYENSGFELIIAEKSLATMVIYKTDFDALNWQPPQTTDLSKVLRVVHNLDYIHFTKYLSQPELNGVTKLTTSYHAIPETTWRSFLDKAKVSKDEEMLNRVERGNNPSEERPYFLKKGKDL